jgi:hypothetical protein
MAHVRVVRSPRPDPGSRNRAVVDPAFRRQACGRFQRRFARQPMLTGLVFVIEALHRATVEASFHFDGYIFNDLPHNEGPHCPQHRTAPSSDQPSSEVEQPSAGAALISISRYGLLQSTSVDALRRNEGWFAKPRAGRPELYDPASYAASQVFGESVRASADDGITYASVRHAGGTNAVCYRPRKVLAVRQAAHYDLAVPLRGRIVARALSEGGNA